MEVNREVITQDECPTAPEQDLSRREVIRRALIMTGATSVIGSSALFNAACSTSSERGDAILRQDTFSAEDVAWLDEVAETILPATDTPGAKAAEVGAFIALMVTDCLSPQEQVQFRANMDMVEAQCRRDHGVGFMAATPGQRLSLLQRLDRERYATRAGDTHYFQDLKAYTVLGYFTSEIGYTQAMRYVESPGRFDPCVDHREGERIWARHA